MEEEEEIIKEKRKPMTISVDPSVRRELRKIKERYQYITVSGLIEFCVLYPYSFGDIIFTLEVLKSSPERKKKFTRCFNGKDLDGLAEIIKEVLNRKKRNEFKLEDAIRYIKNRKEGGENSLIEKKIQEIEDKIADLKTMVRMK